MCIAEITVTVGRLGILSHATDMRSLPLTIRKQSLHLVKPIESGFFYLNASVNLTYVPIFERRARRDCRKYGSDYGSRTNVGTVEDKGV